MVHAQHTGFIAAAAAEQREEVHAVVMRAGLLFAIGAGVEVAGNVARIGAADRRAFGDQHPHVVAFGHHDLVLEPRIGSGDGRVTRIDALMRMALLELLLIGGARFAAVVRQRGAGNEAAHGNRKPALDYVAAAETMTER